MTRPLANVRFSGAASSRVGPARAAVAAALETGAALLASEQLGLAQWCFDTTLAYAKERKQFGRAIGSYQAIKHRLADLWFEVGSATAAARYAADTCARGDEDARIAAAIAQAYCSGTAVHAAEECVQLHGGIGMTWEYPAHLYLKRAKSDQLALGTAYRHRARLAELVDLPAQPDLARSARQRLAECLRHRRPMSLVGSSVVGRVVRDREAVSGLVPLDGVCTPAAVSAFASCSAWSTVND